MPLSGQTAASGSAPTAEELRRRFEHGRRASFGVEEEVMLLDPDTLDLAPSASAMLDTLPDRDGLKLELPAAQLEIVTAPSLGLGELARELTAGRRRLAEGVGARAALLSAGAHPFAAAEGRLNSGPRYERLERRYASVVRRQLICGLHVHVGLDGADRALAVYNAMRAHLPDLAALGANAPIHEGRDSGMASVRPTIGGMLPRQGIPPAFASWQHVAESLAWLQRAGLASSAREWWWELRLHPELGTIEVRVPDAQIEARDAAAVATTAAGLVLWLAARYDGDELGAPAPSWRIAENRWSAARHGVKGEMVDLRTGRSVPTGERLAGLLDEIAPFAGSAGGTELLAHAREMCARGGADRQRELFREGGATELTRSLAAAFLSGETPPGGCSAGA